MKKTMARLVLTRHDEEPAASMGATLDPPVDSGTPRGSEKMRVARQKRRETHRETLALLNDESGLFNACLRVSREVTSANDVRPKRRVGELLQSYQHPPVRNNVLKKPKLPAGTDYPKQLADGLLGLRHGAEHERDDTRVERAVIRRELGCVAVDHRDRHLRLRGGLLCALSQPRFRLDRDHLLNSAGVVREIRSDPGAHLDDPPTQPGDEPAAVLVITTPFADRGEHRVKPREDGIRRALRHAQRGSIAASRRPRHRGDHPWNIAAEIRSREIPSIGAVLLNRTSMFLSRPTKSLTESRLLAGMMRARVGNLDDVCPERMVR